MLPQSFKDKIKEMLKDEAEEFFDSYNKEHYAGLRVNTLKISPEEFEKISPVKLENIPWTNKGFYYDKNDKPAKHPYYYAGLYYIQEPSAMAPAAMLPIEEGDRVLDLCAAPGGKSTELGAKLGRSGMLVSNDISASRAKALLKNIEINGIPNALIVNEAPHKLAENFTEFFDKILVDAPCSGEGMFRKEPAIIKNWEQYGVEYYSKLQREILPSAVKMLRPGGYMLYSTCTFSTLEDEGSLKFILDNYPEMSVEKIDFDFGDNGHPQWLELEDSLRDKGMVNANDIIKELDNANDKKDNNQEDNNSDNEERVSEEINKDRNHRYSQISNAARLWPHKIKGEGHFVALLKKSEDTGRDNFIKNNKDKKTKKKKTQGDNRVKKVDLPDEFYSFLQQVNMSFDESRFIVNNNKVYYTPDKDMNLRGLRILRNGLLMGEIKTKRFEPSQALASALSKDSYDNYIDLKLEEPEVIKYLKGETVELNKEQMERNSHLKNGWGLVCVDGFALGFVKVIGSTLKNKYLPGWRWM
ncbi:MAG: SAM-dependent methyltransferase [Lachnospiraceae bacterium]|nr:SAM-dependent methyltransferase [Lachnospiraceae bacterium]